MDGVLVTYHNTSQIFGFEYVTLEDMDECLYGNKLAGNHIFECSLKLLNLISEEITLKFPEQVGNIIFQSLCLNSYALCIGYLGLV